MMKNDRVGRSWVRIWLENKNLANLWERSILPSNILNRIFSSEWSFRRGIAGWYPSPCGHLSPSGSPFCQRTVRWVPRMVMPKWIIKLSQDTTERKRSAWVQRLRDWFRQVKDVIFVKSSGVQSLQCANVPTFIQTEVHQVGPNFNN